MPAGSTSVTSTPVAVLNPATFRTRTVKITWLPTVGVELLTVLSSSRSIGRMPASHFRSLWPAAKGNTTVRPVAGSASLSIVSLMPTSRKVNNWPAGGANWTK